VGPLKVRWLLFWYGVPQVAAVVLALVLGRPGILDHQIVVIAVTALPLAAYLAARTLGRGPAWFGPLTARRWSAWLPLAGLLAGGYLLLFAGAEPAWAAFWEPRLTALGLPPAHPTLTLPDSAAEGLLLVVLAAGVIPVVEETLFRGPLLRLWARWWGPAAAVAATAAVFGLVHAQGQIFKVVLGLGLAVLALRSGSLLVPITVHALVNLAATALALAFAAAGPEAADPAPAERSPEAEAVLALAGLALLGLFVRRIVRRDHPRTLRRRRAPVRRRTCRSRRVSLNLRA